MKSLLVGDNAFIGVSHLSQERARTKLTQLDPRKASKIVDRAIHAGATGFSFSVHPTNTEILRSLCDLQASPIDLCPVLPYAAGYVRKMNELGVTGVIRDTLSRLSVSERTRAVLGGGYAAVTRDPLRMLNTYVDVELSSLPEYGKLRTVLLHEVITDLGVSFQAVSLFESYMNHLHDRYKLTPGFVTRNLVRFIELFEKSDLPLDEVLIMTPLNKIGFQMNPSREACETILSEPNICGHVIAMSILAGGYLALNESIEYIRRFPNLAGVTIGVSSTQQADETFEKLSSLLDSPPMNSPVQHA